jgi:hypothetical protein
MTDQHEPDPARDLTPDEESRVRGLLADARHTEPMPDDVVARLDRVLTGLAEEPAREAAVVRLADRRRRATRLLVAAAAAVVVGFGGSQVIGGLGGGAADNASSGAEEEPAAESADDPNGVSGDTDGEVEGEPSGPENDAPNALQDRLARIRPDSFAADTQELRDAARNYALTAQQAQRGGSAASLDVCTTGAWGAGRYVAVRYSGDPGWIVFRRPQGTTQVADLFLCGSELASRSLTLPYP